MQTLHVRISLHKQSSNIENALRCSLVEMSAQRAWKRPISKISCFVALHTESAEELIGCVLGGLVKADVRRLDDVRSEVEDATTDCMLLTRSVLALASSVV